MPYEKLSEIPASLKGIEPALTLGQANVVAAWADAMEEADDGPESPWAVSIAQFKRLYEVVDGERWGKKEVAAQEAITCECLKCGHIETLPEGGHCADSKCSQCGGEMRRLERPGRGQLVLAGNSISAKVHNETVGGIEYLVAPAVLLREDVLNDEMVLADEIAAHFKAWNGRPVVVAHPEANGVKVSANDPAILAQQQVGKLFAAAFDGGKLRGELWIEVAKTKTVPGGLETLRRLRSSTPTEISTAYFRDKEMTAGTWGGKDYESIARNLRPDHVAVLLDTKGACNWEDGCGVPRVNEEDAVWGMIALTLPPNVVNEVAVEGGESPEDLHLTIALFKDAQPDLVFDAAKNLALDHFPLTGKINGVGRFSETHKDDGATAFYVNFDSSELPDFRQAVGDSLEAAGIKLEENHGFTPHVTLAYLAPDDPLPFENVLIEDVTLPSISAHCGDEHKVYKLEGKPMKDNETTVVEANESGVLCALKTIFGALGVKFNQDEEVDEVKEMIVKITEDGRLALTEEQLAEVPEEALTAIVELLGSLPEAQEDEDEDETEDEVEDEEKVKAEEQEKTDTPPQANVQDSVAFKTLMARVVTLEAAGKAESAERKAELTTALKANEDCVFTAEQLGDLNVATLEGLHRSLSPADYSGQGGGERKDSGQRPIGIRVAPRKKQEVK